MMVCYNVVRTLCTDCDNRFGSKHLVLHSVLKNHAAVTAWAVSPAFRDIMKKRDAPVHAAAVYDILTSRDADIRTAMTCAADLIDPIMRDTHELEGDKAYLSQMLPIVDKHVAAAFDFMVEHPELSDGVKKHLPVDPTEVASSRLLEFMYRPCMSLAFLLDPANFILLANDSYVAPFAKLGPSGDPELKSSRLADAAALVQRLGSTAGVEEFEMLKLYVIADASRVSMVQRLSLRTAVVASDGKETVSMSPMHERRNFWLSWMPEPFPVLSELADMMLSMQVTACAAEHNWSKWGLMYQKNRSRLGMLRAQQMIFLNENHGFRCDDAGDALDLCA